MIFSVVTQFLQHLLDVSAEGVEVTAPLLQPFR
jgi:hypothetical protein